MQTDEDFLDVTESGNKLVAFIIILIIAGISVFGYFFVYQKFHFAIKTVEVEVGTKLSTDVNDYLGKEVVDTSGYKLDLSKVNIDEVGTYKYTIKYNKTTRTGTIKVVDTKAPDFKVNDETTIEANSDFYLGDLLEYCKDSSLPCLVSFKDEKDYEKLNKIGDYKLKIVVADIYNNKKETEVNLKVVKEGTFVSEKQKDLTYAEASEELKDFKNEYYIKLEKALSPNSEEAKELASEIDIASIETYINEKYPDYKLTGSKIITAYNKSGYVIGYIVEATITNGTEKTVYVTK